MKSWATPDKSPKFFKKISYLLILEKEKKGEREREGERETPSFLLHSVTHPLVDSCVRPDGRWDPQPSAPQDNAPIKWPGPKLLLKENLLVHKIGLSSTHLLFAEKKMRV